MIIEILLIVIAVILLLSLSTKKPDKYPPGPPKWPIFGNRFQMMSWGRLFHQSMNKIANRYGNVVGLYSGQSPLILISGLKAIKELSSRDDFAGRTASVINTKIDKGFYGIIVTAGEKWKEQRRFTLRHLRDLGFGKQSLEGIVHEELQVVFEEVEKFAGGPKMGYSKPVLVHDILGTAGINVLWHLIAGQRYSHSDPYLSKLINNVKQLTTVSQPGGSIASSFPIISKYFPSLTRIPKILTLRSSLLDFITEEVRKHKETIDHEHPRDFIDIYFNEIEKQRGSSTSWYEEKQLVHICIDLFIAGTDTTFNSLTFSFLYMILNPHVQLKVQEELDKVVGRDRLPSLSDRSRLHYVEATLHEILRMSSVAPLAVPHAIPFEEKDVEFQGYIFPKKSRVLLNIYGLHHDPEIWKDPLNFRPERFLDENGKFFKHEALLPFGTGKRVCIGESLARNNLFIFFTGLMQRYYMKVPDGYPLPSDEPDGGFTLVPKPFKVLIQIRK